MKKIKEEKGAITIIVLVSLIFFVSFLVSTYLILANKSQSQLEIIEQTKEIYDNSESITDIYNSYFADEVIPIYTVEQLLKIGTGDNIVIKEAGNKIYNFGQDGTYMLMNDLEFDVADWEGALGEDGFIPIGDIELENGGKVDFEGNNHKITVVDSQNYQYLEDHKRIFEKENNYAIYYTIDDYVKTDLVLWLDGIENTRNGHNSSATVWEDLSEKNDDIILTNVTWNENSAIFNGIDSYGTGSKGNFTKGCTIEVVFMTDKSVSNAYGLAGYSCTSSNTNRPNIFINANNKAYASMSTSAADMKLESNIPILIGEKNYLTLTSKKFFVNGTVYTHTNSITSSYTTTNKFLIGNYWHRDETSFYNNAVLNGQIYEVRVYDRNLSNEEIEFNRKVDQYRFNR